MSFSSYPLSSVLDGESLTAAMLRDMGRLPILLLALAGCGPSTPAVTSAPVGCGKDTDCKGARICMAQRLSLIHI